ncbi:MAG: D-alanine--D-alanine ligase [Candidatus Aminicenantes bacterium]|nr:D-alanine--D-alanine ligase [Candidatus Aminicenantes bacterium]
MDKKTVVALLFGGRSAEHEVSVASAAAVRKNLDPAKFEVVSIFLNREGRWRRVATPEVPPEEIAAGEFRGFLPWSGPGGEEIRADIYFPVLHGPYGEDGTIQGLLDLADVPYVGAGVLGSAAGMDKAVMKELFRSRGLPIVPHRLVREADWRRRAAAVGRSLRRDLRLPLFVKPANLGSSVGVTRVVSWSGLEEAVAEAFRFDRKAVVEQGLACREIECSVLGNDSPRASLPGEVIPQRDFYDYRDKYLDGKTEFGIPAKLPTAVARRVRRLAVEAFLACEGSGLARVDFFLEKGTDRVYVNEINTLPGFTEISMYPKLWAVSGLAFGPLLELLIELGFERHRARRRDAGRDKR